MQKIIRIQVVEQDNLYKAVENVVSSYDVLTDVDEPHELVAVGQAAVLKAFAERSAKQTRAASALGMLRSSSYRALLAKAKEEANE